jgi:hypothetical protein
LQHRTYRRVNRLIALEVAVLPEAVVRLAESDAGKAVGNEACVDRVEAREEAGVPGLGTLSGLLLDDLAGGLEDGVGAGDPVLDVIVVDGAGLGRSSNGSLLSHFECWGIKTGRKRVTNSGYQTK